MANRFLFLFFVFIANVFISQAYNKEVVLTPSKPTHSQWNIPADMPDVYYDSELGVITIVDYANVTYYVTIYDDWWNVALTDTKPGGGTIDVSSLSTGDYVIDITTSWNHEYEGEFTVP